MISCFYSVILSSLDFFLPVISVTKWSTDKPWVTPKFRELVISRQKAFLSGDLVRYHRLRNSTQRLAAKLRKSYFTSQVEQLHSSDPRQWWSKTKRILKREDPNPLVNLDYLGHPGQLPEYINDFFVSVSVHLPKVDSAILKTLNRRLLCRLRC